MKSEIAVLRFRALGRNVFSNSLYLFDKYLLGYDKMVARIHKPMCEFFEPPPTLKGRDFALLLEPRKIFKTCCCCIGFVIWMLLKNQNEKALIAGSTKDEAAKRLASAKRKMEENSRLKVFYVDLAKYHKQKTLWKQESVVVSGRTITDLEPSIDTMGRGQDKTGNHYTIIIGDDLENKETVNSDVELANTKQLILGLLACMMPVGIPSIMRIIGTHWDDDDAYCMLRGRGEEYRGKFSYWRPRITSAEDEDGNPTMPEILPAEDLKVEKSSLSVYEYSCNFLNDPVPRTESHFPPQNTVWWYGKYFNQGTAKYIEIDKFVKEDEDKKDAKPYEWRGPKVVQIKPYLLVDPALSENKQSSHSALLIAAKQMDENRIWVIDGYRVKSQEVLIIVKMMITLIHKYDPLRAGIEDIAFQLSLKSYFESEARKQGIYTPVDTFGRNDHRSKDDRILGLSPFWRSEMIMLPGNQLSDSPENAIKALKRELWRFRVGGKSNKDMADALARINDIDVGQATQTDLRAKIRNIERNRIRDWFLR